MSNDKPQPRFPAGINAEEKRAWASFYARVGKDPLLAAELIAELNSDIELKRMHLALYLCSREAIRVHQSRQTGNLRIAHALRWLFRAVFVIPARLLATGLRHGTDIALASLPEEAQREPAIRQVKRIERSGKFAVQKAEFDKQQQQHTG